MTRSTKVAESRQCSDFAAVKRAWVQGRLGITERVVGARPCSVLTQALLFGLLLECVDRRTLSTPAGSVICTADLAAGYVDPRTTRATLGALEKSGLVRVVRHGKQIMSITLTPPLSVLRPAQPPPDVKASLRAAVMERDGFACRYCRVTDDLTLDHIIPRRLGGMHALDNLVTACRPCNSRKGPQTPEQAGMRLLEVPR